MATFNGTQVADTISGTNDADVINGLAGDDVINGAGGDDQINGGADSDDILGGSGNDTITVDSAADIGATEKIDGGDDSDTLISGLVADDVINKGAGILWGMTATTQNLEFVQVTNADDYMLDLSANAIFGSGVDIVSSSGATAGPVDLDILSYTAATGKVADISATQVDESAGLLIGGVVYEDGDDFTSDDGGTVVVSFDSTAGLWGLSYTPEAADIYAVGDAGSPDDDIVNTITATVTDENEDTLDVTVNLASNLGADYDASMSSVGVKSPGDSQDNMIIGSAFDDVIYAGGAVGSGEDAISGGAGNDILGGGDEMDILNGDAGNDTLFGGAGDDTLSGGEGNDTIWGGADVDTITGGEGDDIIGAGTGDDTVSGGEGNDTFYGAAGNDTLNGGAGDDTLFGGDGVDALDGGAGDDTIFNGAGDDTMVSGGDGDDTIWGGAGNDMLAGDAGDDTFAFDMGNGNDTITDFDITSTDPDVGDMLDLTAFGFADTQAVIDAMTDVGINAVLAIAPGQTITFDNLVSTDFQAAVDDWVMV